MAAATSQWDSRIGRRLKLRDLHILFAVVRWGSMAKAAAHIGMSQPAVSEAIAGLESTLKVRLLDRSPRGVEPTIYAEALLKRGHVVFDELRQSIRDIEFLTDPTAGEVRIGCPESLVAGFVPAVIDRLSRWYPQIAIHVIHAQTGLQEFRELRDRSVDLMLGRIFKPLVSDEIDAEILGEDTMLVAAGAKSPWALRRKIGLAALTDELWIAYPPDNFPGSFIREAFRAKGLEPPRESVTSFSLHVRMQLLATGRFLTVLQGSVLRFHAKRWSLKALPVDLGLPPVPLAIFTLKNRTLSPVVNLFIEHARTVAKSMMTAR
jgi:DNA-binding transcriptional LysR family regulator